MKNLLIISLFFFISSCKVENLPLKVKGKGVFYGNIYFDDGVKKATTFEGVIVAATNENGTYVDTTLQNGNFIISNLPRGTYDINYSKEGYYKEATKGVQTNGKDSVAIKLFYGYKPNTSHILIKKFNLYIDEFEITESNNLVTITSLKFHAANIDTNSTYLSPEIEWSSNKYFNSSISNVYISPLETVRRGFNIIFKYKENAIFKNMIETYNCIDNFKTGDTVFLRPVLHYKHQKNHIVKYFIKK